MGAPNGPQTPNVRNRPSKAVAVLGKARAAPNGPQTPNVRNRPSKAVAVLGIARAARGSGVGEGVAVDFDEDEGVVG
jgi:hypothetical protein